MSLLSKVYSFPAKNHLLVYRLNWSIKKKTEARRTKDGCSLCFFPRAGFEPTSDYLLNYTRGRSTAELPRWGLRREIEIGTHVFSFISCNQLSYLDLFPKICFLLTLLRQAFEQNIHTFLLVVNEIPSILYRLLVPSAWFGSLLCNFIKKEKCVNLSESRFKTSLLDWTDLFNRF